MNNARVRRRLLCGMALVGCAAAAEGRAAAPGTRTDLRLLVGFPPGGATDVVARLYAEQWRALGNASVLVENKPGAGGWLAVEALSAAPPDGATLLVTPASLLTITPHAYPRSTRYDPLRDLVPVSPLCSFPFAWVVPAAHPARSLDEFRLWASGRGTVAFASPAAGSMPHLPALTAQEWFGLFLPGGSSPEILSLFHRRVGSAQLAAPVVNGLTRLDYQPLLLSPDAFAARLLAEHAEWGQAVRKIELALE
ncbi:tripartite tricarboxylate transporter substrate-binding protein [Teichococcus aestuarii]|uniref:tripartite tricarboxylate transporter substrate-binding protein n=1 Tax=Teichococcus aestuarii TaxID=568898 RepID=UPI0015E7F65D|nr:tripartite tricarboxylate transporter substrate-binding protein [Pseudoroseomonas aestuarii]